MFKSRWLLVITLIFSTTFLGVLGYIVSTLLEFPLDSLTVVKGSSNIRQRASFRLDADSELKKENLMSFLLFSALEKKRDAFLLEKSRLGEIKLEKSGRIYIERDFEVPGLLTNDCSELYCYQHRLSLGEIPSFFWKGLISTEDRRFLEHQGIDIKGIIRALAIDILKMKMVQGASTLTQQLIKNLFLTNEKKISRKIKEMILAVYVELKFSKEEIMMIYFNEIFWGSFQGIKIKGIYAASLFYFQKPIAQLSPFEATILISLLKGPYYYGPIAHLDRLKSRARVVYKKLLKAGLVSVSDRFEWKNDRWKEWHKDLKQRQSGRQWRELVRIARSETSFLNDFEKYVFGRSVQKVEQRANKKIESVTDQKVSTLAFVYALMGKEREQYAYYSRWGRSPYDVIDGRKNQVGSTLKPLIYSILIKQGIKFEQSVSTEPMRMNLKSGRWSPKEGSRVKKKEVSVRQALQRSLNNPLIRLVDEVGFDIVEQNLLEMIPNLQVPLREYPAQMLGAIELTMKELINSYYIFITKQCVLNQELYEKTLDILSDPTQTTLKRSVNKQLSQFKFFGKTGTTNKSVDNLFVFFDGKLLGVIWVGIEGKRPEKSLHLGGSATAFKVFQNFILSRGKRFNILGCPNAIGMIKE